ncbi:hypothetical protein E4U54_004865 [Claviceps lovelessii]|nr:hypothetical protein E4U54_004865 [Claviceps lovelessii]
MAIEAPLSSDLASHGFQHLSCNEDSELMSISSHEDPWQEVEDPTSDDEEPFQGLKDATDDDFINVCKMFKQVCVHEERKCEGETKEADSLRTDVEALNEKIASQAARIEQLEATEKKLRDLETDHAANRNHSETLADELAAQTSKIQRLEKIRERLIADHAAEQREFLTLNRRLLADQTLKLQQLEENEKRFQELTRDNASKRDELRALNMKIAFQASIIQGLDVHARRLIEISTHFAEKQRELETLEDKLTAQTSRIQELEAHERKSQELTSHNAAKQRELETLNAKLSAQDYRIRVLQTIENKLREVTLDNAAKQRELDSLNEKVVHQASRIRELEMHEAKPIKVATIHATERRTLEEGFKERLSSLRHQIEAIAAGPAIDKRRTLPEYQDDSDFQERYSQLDPPNRVYLIRERMYKIIHYCILGEDDLGLVSSFIVDNQVSGNAAFSQKSQVLKLQKSLADFEGHLRANKVPHDIISNWRLATFKCVKTLNPELQARTCAPSMIWGFLRHLVRSPDDVQELRSKIAELCANAYSLRFCTRQCDTRYYFKYPKFEKPKHIFILAGNLCKDEARHSSVRSVHLTNICVRAATRRVDAVAEDSA